MDLNESERPMIGYIPAGSTNDFAETVKIPKKIEDASLNLIKGMPFSCDVGRFNNDYFLYVAAFGAFSDVSYDTPQDMKNTLGHSAYVIEGMKRLTNLPKIKMTVVYDGGEVTGNFIYGMVSNTTSVAGIKTLGKNNVILDDGLFEIVLVKYPENPADIQNILSSVLTNDFSQPKAFKVIKTKNARFISDEEIKWTLDGEYGGTHKNVEVENISKAVSIVIPKDSPVFSSKMKSSVL